MRLDHLLSKRKVKKTQRVFLLLVCRRQTRVEIQRVYKVSDVQHGPLFIKPLVLSFPPFYLYDGDIAQLARASALQAEGQGFESPYLQ